MIPTLVLSCDSHRYLWPGFLHYWRMHAPTDLGRVCIATDKRPRVIVDEPLIITRRTESWTDHVRAAVEMFGEPWFLLMLEDFWIDERTKDIPWQEAIAFSQRVNLPVGLHGDYRAYVHRDKVQSIGHLFARQFAPHSPYQTSLQPTIWERDQFLSLLADGENPWEFEIIGSRRASAANVCRWRLDVDWYTHCVKRGRWLPQGEALENERVRATA